MLLANHGPVVAGTSLSAASASIEELEETAKLHLLLQGFKVRLLSDAPGARSRGSVPVMKPPLSPGAERGTSAHCPKGPSPRSG